MKKFWAVLAIIIIASLNLNVFAKGKSRYSVGKKGGGAQAKKQSLSLNTNFCEFINGSVGFLVCASGKAGDEKLTREELYEIKQSSVLLSKKIQTSKAKKIAFKRQKSKNPRKASKIVNANPKYCSVFKGTPNITVCAQGKPGQAAITNLSLSSVQEAALAVQKKYNKANKPSFLKYVIDNMSSQSCEYIYGAGDSRCDEGYEGSSGCESDPYAEGCPDFCMMNLDHPSCGGTGEPDCSDPSGPYYDVAFCEGSSTDCESDPYAEGCPDFCMMNLDHPSCP